MTDYSKTYYLYKITNLLNGKIYIGQHTTDAPIDGYFCGGSLVQQAIQHYGIEHFKKEIIEEFLTPEDLDKAERAMVDIKFVRSPMTYNLALGGKSTKSFEIEYLEELGPQRWFRPTNLLIAQKAQDFKYVKNAEVKLDHDKIIEKNTLAFNREYLGIPETYKEIAEIAKSSKIILDRIARKEALVQDSIDRDLFRKLAQDDLCTAEQMNDGLYRLTHWKWKNTKDGIYLQEDYSITGLKTKPKYLNIKDFQHSLEV